VITAPKFGLETEKLLIYLEKRGLSGQEACAIMGFAIEALINDHHAATEFLEILTERLRAKTEKQ
jgi:hypothetical protein